MVCLLGPSPQLPRPRQPQGLPPEPAASSRFHSRPIGPIILLEFCPPCPPRPHNWARASAIHTATGQRKRLQAHKNDGPAHGKGQLRDMPRPPNEDTNYRWPLPTGRRSYKWVWVGHIFLELAYTNGDNAHEDHQTLWSHKDAGRGQRKVSNVFAIASSPKAISDIEDVQGI